MTGGTVTKSLGCGALAGGTPKLMLYLVRNRRREIALALARLRAEDAMLARRTAGASVKR